MQLDVEKFVGGLHDYLSKAFAPLVKRLEALEARQPERGEKGETGPAGAAGAPGLAGVDGKSVTLADLEPLLKSMQDSWALDFERRAQALFQKAVDSMPKPQDGKDGIDGIGWDSMRVEHDGRRSFEFVFTKDGADHPYKFTIPCLIDVGFYREGMSVEKGDGVTFGGSYWIAQEDTDTKPGVGNPAYRLAVRKGRDGKRD